MCCGRRPGGIIGGGVSDGGAFGGGDGGGDISGESGSGVADGGPPELDVLDGGGDRSRKLLGGDGLGSCGDPRALAAWLRCPWDIS